MWHFQYGLADLPFRSSWEHPALASIALVVGILVVVGMLVLYLLARNREWALGLFDSSHCPLAEAAEAGGNFLAPFSPGWPS